MILPLQTRANLVTLYGEPHRHYHNLSHVYQCLAEFHALLGTAHGMTYNDIASIELAIWFHDCVYNPKAQTPTNETESADLALETLHELRIKDSVCDLVKEMITATGEHTHQKSYPLSTQYFLDIDLAVLGSPFREYEQYARNIRKEYSFVDEDQYNVGRIMILKGIIRRDKIYYTQHFRDKYEAQARKNIQWEIDALSSFI